MTSRSASGSLADSLPVYETEQRATISLMRGSPYAGARTAVGLIGLAALTLVWTRLVGLDTSLLDDEIASITRYVEPGPGAIFSEARWRPGNHRPAATAWPSCARRSCSSAMAARRVVRYAASVSARVALTVPRSLSSSTTGLLLRIRARSQATIYSAS